MLTPEGKTDGASQSSCRKRGRILYLSRKELQWSRNRGTKVIFHSQSMPSGCFAESKLVGDLIGGSKLKDPISEEELLKYCNVKATSHNYVRKFSHDCPPKFESVKLSTLGNLANKTRLSILNG